MPSYPPYRNIPRSLNDNSGSTNTKSLAEQARFRRATELATTQFENLRKASSFASPVWDERLMALEEAIAKKIEQKKNEPLTAEELLALEQKQILRGMIKSGLDEFHEQHSIIERIQYGLDIARKIEQTSQSGSMDAGSRTGEFYVLKGVLDGTNSVQNAVATLRRDLVRKDISRARKDEIERTIGQLIGTMSRNVPEPVVQKKSAEETSGPIVKTSTPEEPRVSTGRGDTRTLEQRIENEAQKMFTEMEQRLTSGDDQELFWNRGREWVTRLMSSRGMVAQGGKEQLRTEFEIRKLKVLLGLISDALQRLHDREEAEEARRKEEQERNRIKITTSRALPPPFTIQAVQLPDGTRAVPKQPKAERVPPRPVIDFGAIAIPQEEDQELPSGPDEDIFAMDEADEQVSEEELKNWMNGQIKIPITKIPEEKSGKIGVGGGMTRPQEASLKEGEDISPREILERRKPEEEDVLELPPEIEVSELPPQIDLQSILEDGEARAKKDIINLVTLINIGEFIEGLFLHLYGEHEQLDLLKDYAEDIVDVSDYAKPLSPDLLKKMEEDVRKMLRKTNFRQKFSMFLKEKARFEALEKYLLSQPIPVDDAEGYLGVIPHANRQAVELAYGRLLQGLDVEKNARQITALHEARRKAIVRVEKEEKEAEEGEKIREEAERQRLLNAVHEAEKPKSKDLTALMNEKLPARKWYETVSGILGGIGAAVAVALGVHKADELLSSRPVAEPQAENIPLPIPTPVALPIPRTESVTATAKPVEAPVSRPRIELPSLPAPVSIPTPAPLPSVQKEQHESSSDAASVAAKEHAPLARDFTARSIVVQEKNESGKRDTVDGILRAAFKAYGISFEGASQMIKNFVQHQVVTENNLKERKDEKGKLFIDIEAGQSLSLDGLQDTLETLVEKGNGSGKVERVERSTSSDSVLGDREITPLGVGSSGSSQNRNVAQEGNPSIAQGVTTDRPSEVIARPSVQESREADLHTMKKWESIWKFVHDELRKRGLNWTSERINFLTQVIFDANANVFRAAVASGQMKAMKDTAIPEGLVIDCTLANAIMDEMKLDRDTKGKSKSIKELAGIYGKKYPISLKFPS